MNDIQLISWDSNPLTESELSVVENAVGRLPSDYRGFLLASNGGRTVADEVRFPLSDAEDDFHYVTAFSVIESEFPPEVLTPKIHGSVHRLLKIAKCYDSPFLMRLNGPNVGTVYYWDYHLEDLWDAEEAGHEYLPDEDSLYVMAPSFTDFVNQLVRVSTDKAPRFEQMNQTVENFAKYGDHFFEMAKSFFDTLSIDELNERWPKNDENAFQPIHYAANWSQVCTSRYLIDRGVDIHKAVTCCTSNFEITQMLIQAGASDQELRELLLSAAAGMPATSVPDEHHKIIMHLIDRGVQPDFTDTVVVQNWFQFMNQIYAKKILAFLLSVIDFPGSIAACIRDKLAKPQE